MTDPVQAAIGIVVALIVVGALLYIFYSRTNSVEKTGFGALMMLAVVSLLIPVFWITESNAQELSTLRQHTTDVSRGAALYAQYCFQCHGINGQGLTGPKLNGSAAVNKFTDADILRIISGGIANTADPSQLLMPAWSEDFGGPLTQIDIQYLFALIRSSDPDYLAKNGFPTGPGSNGFDQVPPLLQVSNPTAYQTAVAQATAAVGTGQFGTPVDATKSTAVDINIVIPPTGATCTPACFAPINIKVKVGTTITWTNKSSTPHTVTAMVGENPGSETPAPQIFDSGTSKLILPGEHFTYTVTLAAYNFNKNHVVLYYCQIHPAMVAELTIVP
ncbi:MAG TPA: c-type cytochrome [Ktedonobacteraceae bacterium]|jgi:plastocyanin/mono/diheme cytochrome c family protein